MECDGGHAEVIKHSRPCVIVNNTRSVISSQTQAVYLLSCDAVHENTTLSVLLLSYNCLLAMEKSKANMFQMFIFNIGHFFCNKWLVAMQQGRPIVEGLSSMTKTLVKQSDG